MSNLIKQINEKYGVSERIDIPACVYALYHDGKGDYMLTVNELEEKFKEETQTWKDWFFKELLSNGIAKARFADYKIVKYDDNGNKIPA